MVPPYTKSTSFQDTPTSEAGAALDDELRAVAVATRDFVSGLGDVRRSDGKLVNLSVAEQHLAPGLVDEFVAPVAEDAIAAEAAAVNAIDASDEAQLAASAAEEQSAALGRLLAQIRRDGWPDYGSITDPPGPPNEGNDYGTL